MIASLSYHVKVKMNKNCRIKKSQENWKTKAKIRSSENCELRKKINRLEENILIAKLAHEADLEQLKCEIKNTLIVNSNAEKDSLFCSSYLKLRVLCIQLLIVGVISFRSVPRILKIIGNSIGLNHTPPHFTSVINWSLRAGIGIFKKSQSIYIF
jgi:hypothetical protein